MLLANFYSRVIELKWKSMENKQEILELFIKTPQIKKDVHKNKADICIMKKKMHVNN